MTMVARRPAKAGGGGGRAAGPAEQDLGQDLPVDRADDQHDGGVDVGGSTDAAELLLGVQVRRQQVRQAARPPGLPGRRSSSRPAAAPGSASLLSAGGARCAARLAVVVSAVAVSVSAGDAERRVAADHRLEAGQHPGLRLKPRERGRHPAQHVQALVDEQRQVPRHGPGPGGRHRRRAGHDRADVGQQPVGEQVVLVREVVVQGAVGHLRLAGEVADGQPGAAALADEPGRRRDQVLPQALAATAEGSGLPR